jgi:hypothetical protein
MTVRCHGLIFFWGVDFVQTYGCGCVLDCILFLEIPTSFGRWKYFFLSFPFIRILKQNGR